MKCLMDFVKFGDLMHVEKHLSSKLSVLIMDSVYIVAVRQVTGAAHVAWIVWFRRSHELLDEVIEESAAIFEFRGVSIDL